MKRISTLIVISLVLLNLSCVEEVPVDNTNFIKYFGKESGTFGTALYEYPNGNIVVGAKVDVPAFDYSNVGGSFVIGQALEGTMALIESDKNGLQTNFSAFPISAHETIPEVTLEDISGRSLINEMIPTSDGGFIISGEWRGMGATLIIDGETLTFDASPNVTAPFIMKVSVNRDIEFIRSFNGEVGWDEIYRAKARIKLLNDGTIGVLLGVNVYNFYQPPEELFEGYTFLKIDQTGSTLFEHDFYQPELRIKHVRDFIVDQNDNFVGIGQYNDDIRLFAFNLNNPVSEYSIIVDNSGMLAGYPNTNDFFIEQFPDGSYVIAYPNPGDDSRIALVSSDLTVGNPIIHAPPSEYPRVLELTTDDHILVYTEYLSTSTVPEGFLYKMNRQGVIKFKKRFEGTPGSVLESRDGTYLVLSNPLFNYIIPKARLTKLTKDGNTF